MKLHQFIKKKYVFQLYHTMWSYSSWHFPFSATERRSPKEWVRWDKTLLEAGKSHFMSGLAACSKVSWGTVQCWQTKAAVPGSGWSWLWGAEQLCPEPRRHSVIQQGCSMPAPVLGVTIHHQALLWHPRALLLTLAQLTHSPALLLGPEQQEMQNHPWASTASSWNWKEILNADWIKAG